MSSASLVVTHVTNDDNMPGASRAGYRLHRSLLHLGVDSRVLAGYKHFADDRTSLIPRGDWVGRSVEWRSDRLLRKLGFGDLFYPRFRSLLRHPWIRGADAIQLHKLHGGHFSLYLLEELGRSRPLIWTWHDMWAVSGYCYGALDCQRWMIGCGRCPQIRDPARIPIALEPPPWFDTTSLQWAAKRRLYAKSRFTVVTPSRWLEGIARASPLMQGRTVYTIPNGVDTALFRPDRRQTKRRLAGIAEGERLLFFVTGKGDAVFAQALQRISQLSVGNVRVAIAGPDASAWPAKSPFRVIALGMIPESEMAEWFAAADLFVLPTLQDNFPQVIVESMACGTPVVASATGGVPELVRPGESGKLIPAGDAEALATAVSDLLVDEPLRSQMRERCRAIVESEYSLEQQGRAYRELYLDLKSEYARESAS